MAKKIVSLVLIVCMLAAMTVTVSADGKVDPRDGVVVVSIWFFGSPFDAEFSSGSGFFITDQYLVTNWHVIQQYLDCGAGKDTAFTYSEILFQGKIKIRIYYNENDYEEAYYVTHDENKDLALLRLANPTTKRTPLKLLVPTEDMIFSEPTIYAVGYPGLSDNPLVDSTTSRGKNDASVSPGGISKLFVSSGTGRQSIEITCNIKHGNSGGPVVTSNGNVIGIVTSYINSTTIEENGNGLSIDTDKIFYATSTADLLLMLNPYDLPIVMANTSSAPDDSTIPTGNIDSDPGKSDNTLLIVLIAAIAVLIIGILVVIILMQKKNAKPAPMPAVPVMPVMPATPAARPIVRSYSRSNYGTSVQAGSHPILIGRSANCSLRFPGDAPGISSNHCTIQFDSATKDFIVTDMGSTYGTFLMTGQKMQPNMPYRLRSGDKFYLAEQGNTIGVTLE